jgi:peptidoglycan/LPS O-acetylase OafA/YrhL
MTPPLLLAHGLELLSLYLAATAIGYALAGLALWLVWKKKRVLAIVLSVPAMVLGTVLAATIHAFWGKGPFVLSLLALVLALPGRRTDSTQNRLRSRNEDASHEK